MAPTSRRLIASLIVAAATVSTLLIAVRPRVTPQVARAGSTPVIPAEKSAVPVSTASANLALTREIDRAIDESALAQARWGVFVISMSDGRVLYSRNGDKLFTPASNMKVYTTAVALDLLGADYRWRTSVYVGKQPDNGVVDGDMILYGRGAPDLRS